MSIEMRGAANLAGFVGATAGRRGSVAEVPGGVAVASPFPVNHAYVNMAIRVDPGIGASAFLNACRSVFDAKQRTFVLWVGADEPDLVEAAERAEGQLGGPGIGSRKPSSLVGLGAGRCSGSAGRHSSPGAKTAAAALI